MLASLLQVRLALASYLKGLNCPSQLAFWLTSLFLPQPYSRTVKIILSSC